MFLKSVQAIHQPVFIKLINPLGTQGRKKEKNENKMNGIPKPYESSSEFIYNPGLPGIFRSIV